MLPRGDNKASVQHIFHIRFKCFSDLQIHEIHWETPGNLRVLLTLEEKHIILSPQRKQLYWVQTREENARIHPGAQNKNLGGEKPDLKSCRGIGAAEWTKKAHLAM